MWILDQIYKPGSQILQSVCNEQVLTHLSGCSVRPPISSIGKLQPQRAPTPFTYHNKFYDVNFTTPLLGRTLLPSSFRLLQLTPAQRPLYRAGAPTSQEMVLTMPGQNLTSFVRPIIVWLTNPSLESGECEHPFSYPESWRLSNLRLCRNLDQSPRHLPSILRS